MDSEVLEEQRLEENLEYSERDLDHEDFEEREEKINQSIRRFFEAQQMMRESLLELRKDCQKIRRECREKSVEMEQKPLRNEKDEALEKQKLEEDYLALMDKAYLPESLEQEADLEANVHTPISNLSDASDFSTTLDDEDDFEFVEFLQQPSFITHDDNQVVSPVQFPMPSLQSSGRYKMPIKRLASSFPSIFVILKEQSSGKQDRRAIAFSKDWIILAGLSNFPFDPGG